MKLSLNWIRDYVDLPQDMDLKRLAYDLTMSTVEVEDRRRRREPARRNEGRRGLPRRHVPLAR